jgi:hypothetical protein
MLPTLCGRSLLSERQMFFRASIGVRFYSEPRIQAYADTYLLRALPKETSWASGMMFLGSSVNCFTVS